ncbi:hypothetical protein [Moellerella wisconsensis]|uniref:hypothetical protein n=1 Tax=Moellerella wisconsensis TaxID=158849 RepID=UPI000640E863|nr:hypothetical protein [Moellerella wisconsensis]KLN96897.1 hypothetical protein VK86_07570 [Moellerella wisconsensis]
MDNQLFEQLVNQIMQRFQPKVLLVLTAASGYQHEIYQRLKQCNRCHFSLYIAENARHIHSLEQWDQLGEVINPEQATLVTCLAQYQHLFIPFMDFSTLGDLANGLFNRQETQLIHAALMQNINIIALAYNCSPTSELNTLLGMNKNTAHNQLIQKNIEQLIGSGIDFCSLPDAEHKLTSHQTYSEKPYFDKSGYPDQKSEIAPITEQRYITLNDVMNNPGEYNSTRSKLTDSAIDYLKNLKSKS